MQSQAAGSSTNSPTHSLTTLYSKVGLDGLYAKRTVFIAFKWQPFRFNSKYCFDPE